MSDSLGELLVNIGSSSLQTLPSVSLHDTVIVLQSVTFSSTSKHIGASSTLLNVLVIFLLMLLSCDCAGFAIVASCASRSTPSF